MLIGRGEVEGFFLLRHRCSVCWCHNRMIVKVLGTEHVSLYCHFLIREFKQRLFSLSLESLWPVLFLGV